MAPLVNAKVGWVVSSASLLDQIKAAGTDPVALAHVTTLFNLPAVLIIFVVTTLLVVGSYLGTLSHSLTAAAALRTRGARVAGVIVSESAEQPAPAAETAMVLARFLTPTTVQVLPRHANRGATPLLPLLAPYLR